VKRASFVAMTKVLSSCALVIIKASFCFAEMSSLGDHYT
jgi:hypothetical protein